MIKKIAIIGGGSTGHGVAALLDIKGFEVTLHDDTRFSERLEQAARKGIILRGKIRGLARGIKTTLDAGEALRSAELVMVHVMASRHAEIARRIAPYIVDGQHVLIVPGNLGAPVFRKVFDEYGVSGDVTLTEMEGNLFPCRLTGATEVTVGLDLRGKKVASFPSADTAGVIAALQGVLELGANLNIFEGAVNTNNVVMHISTTLLSATRIEKTGPAFNLFKEGFTPAAVACATIIHQERLRIIEALGFTEHGSPLAMIGKLMDPENNPDNETFRGLMGPDNLSHRYITEDASCGAAFLISAGKRLGLEAPLLEAFVRIAGAINACDYMKEGRTLENLGFPSDMPLEKIFAAV